MDTNVCEILNLNLRDNGVHNKTARFKLKFLCNISSHYHKNKFISYFSLCKIKFKNSYFINICNDVFF